MAYYDHYKDYIKEQVNALLDGAYNVECEDNNVQFEGGLNDVVIVFLTIGGTVDYDDVRIQPFSLTFWFNEANEEVNKAIEDLCIANNRKSITICLSNYRQYFNLPQQIEAHNMDASGFKAVKAVYGSLIITENVSDITKIEFDNLDVPFIDSQINYIAQPSTYKESGTRLCKSKVKLADVKISVTMYNRVNAFTNKIKALRTGKTSPNNSTILKVYFTDGSDEIYDTYVDSSSLQVDKQNPAKLVVVFGIYG